MLQYGRLLAAGLGPCLVGKNEGIVQILGQYRMLKSAVMKGMIALIGLTICTPLVAQNVPYKLVIRWYQSDLTVIDYPTKARCEAARTAVLDEIVRLQMETQKTYPGATPVGPSFNGAFCIPG